MQTTQTILNEAIQTMGGMCNLEESPGNRCGWIALGKEKIIYTGCLERNVNV